MGFEMVSTITPRRRQGLSQKGMTFMLDMSDKKMLRSFQKKYDDYDYISDYESDDE